MNDLIAAAILLVLAMVGVVIRKTYYYVPLHELKRQAERHDAVAEKLYRAVAYGDSLRGLMWLFIAVTSACGIVLLARVAPLWLSVLAVVALLWIAFSWLPASKPGSAGSKLTALVTPLVSWLLNYLDPILGRGVRLAQKRYSGPKHTGIFERDDLLQFLEQQHDQPDSRLTDEELEIIRRAVTFSKHTIGEILISRKELKTVLAEETVGPVLIDELHKAGQEFVLVKDSPRGMVIGSLDVASLGIKSSGKVKDLMSSKVYYLHEQDSLSEALHAFYSTNHPVFIVVNNFEEFLGIVTVESILQQLLGHIPGDDFEEYANVTAVAARHTKKPEPEIAVETPEEVVE